MLVGNQILITLHFPKDLLAQIDLRAAELKLHRNDYLRDLARKNVPTAAIFRANHAQYTSTRLAI
jgi:hypothetical protein